jgi:hypothetical protein
MRLIMSSGQIHRRLAAVALVLCAFAAVAERSPLVAAAPPAFPHVAVGIFDGTVPEMKRIHSTFFRAAAHWGSIEPVEGAFDWSALDHEVIPKTRAGIHVIIAIHSNSAWGSACGGAVFSTPINRPAFKEFVRRLVERYDGDGVDDAPGLRTPVRYFQVENQWVTAVFYRDRTNCPMPGEPLPPSTEDVAATGDLEASGHPMVAAADYVAEYKAARGAALLANPDALLGPGNVPSGAADAALFCLGRLGKKLPQNILRPDGTVKLSILWTKRQVCNKRGVNERGIKSFIRYNKIVLERAMPKLVGIVDYLDIAQYGLYQNVPLRNQWIAERAAAWGFSPVPPIVSWEMGGPDRRVLTPGPAPIRDVAYDVVKRLSLAFATGTGTATWFHNHFNPAAAVGVRFTSLLDAKNKKLPGYWNLLLLTERLAGAKSATMEVLGNAQGYVVKFRRNAAHQVIVAWADGGLSTRIALKHASVQVIQARGKRNMPATVTAAAGRKLNVDLTEVPILILD